LSTSASDQDERRHWENLRQNRIALVVTIVLGVAGIAVPIVWNALHPDHADTPATSAERVEACKKAHKVPDKQDMSAPNKVPHRYVYCSWPPVPGAGHDGYYEITVTEHDIPGTAAVEKYTSVQVFESECTMYQLQYKFQSMGTYEIQDPLLVYSDQIVSMYNGEAVNLYVELGGVKGIPSSFYEHFEPRPGRLIVLGHVRYLLEGVICVDPAHPPKVKQRSPAPSG
jgi:hypothetical protein